MAGAEPVTLLGGFLLVNYGSPLRDEFPARIQGHFSSCTLLRPESADRTLPVARRGSTTEVAIPELDCAAVLRFV